MEDTIKCKVIVEKFIDEIKENEPIFIEDINDYVCEVYKKSDVIKIKKNINVIMNRLNNEKKIKTFYKGIYYKPQKNIFGEMPLDKDKVIRKKYLEDKKGNIKGYISGAKLFNKLGLTTQVPNITEIVTNEATGINKYNNKKLNIIIKTPKIKLNNQNYLYLQLIEIIANKEKINIENKNYYEIIMKFIKENNLDFEKIIKYSRETKNKKVMDVLYEIAQ